MQESFGGQLVAPHSDDPPIDASAAVYGISVAAQLVGSAPQNLRLYEARGLLSPARSPGGTRRYSGEDLARLREIGRLLEAGLNLTGIIVVLELRAANQVLQRRLDEAQEAEPRSQISRPVRGGTSTPPPRGASA
jgi:MerR family transcriptional regulator, heat shock protein HspR